MMNAASTSNPSFIVDVGEAYPNPTHVIGPNFVTVKLSGKSQYNLWRIQMECLLKSQHMVDFIKGAENGKGKRKVGDMAMEASDSLVKGWILGSLSEEAARKAVNHFIHMKKNPDFTAKDLWDELQRSYGPSVREQAAETKLTIRQAESVTEVNPVSEDAKSKDEPTKEKSKKEKIEEEEIKRVLYTSIIKGDYKMVLNGLEGYRLNPWDKLTNNGNTVLHVAVGSSTKNHELLKKLLEMTPVEEYTLLDVVNSDGSSLLHVAAIGGYIEAVDILVQRNPELLLAKDKEGHTPLAISVSNMHMKTSECLFEHMKEKGYGSYFSGQSGEDLVVLAISCQDFRLAENIILYSSDAILSDSDAVLTALAQNFPRDLNFWERRDFLKEFGWMSASYTRTTSRLWNYVESSRGHHIPIDILIILFMILLLGLFTLAVVLAAVFYQCLKKLARPFVYNTFSIHKDATSLLKGVCFTMHFNKANSSTYHQYYTNSIFEATRQNATTFVRHIMMQFPDAIWSANEEGHNFIQHSVINRSNKIYSLLYEMSEHKNIYKTIKDSSENNLLHLAARLAPTNKLNLISGAALQIQRELQWFKEVERFVCPLNKIQKNSDDETPQMVFTRQHKDLLSEGEKWIKKTANSYTIVAILIITIVFAAAITVPGGNNQQSGIPIFANKIAFKVFAISDAISLLTGVTSLLMSLSILTARCAEEDFLFKLPTKLIIGLTMLFLSTTAMIIAFGATLFLVFGQSKSSTLIPIVALTCLPIASFVTLQFRLIVELISATYCSCIFVRDRYGYFY